MIAARAPQRLNGAARRMALAIATLLLGLATRPAAPPRLRRAAHVRASPSTSSSRRARRR